MGRAAIGPIGVLEPMAMTVIVAPPIFAAAFGGLSRRGQAEYRNKPEGDGFHHPVSPIF
jgi:hypothetical protein